MLKARKQRTKLGRSELPTNDAMRRFNAPRPLPLLHRVPILRHCDAFVTNFTATEFRYQGESCCTEPLIPLQWISGRKDRFRPIVVGTTWTKKRYYYAKKTTFRKGEIEAIGEDC
ncbi:hypothetical protein EVAR_63470_1 [Eumeta japonica]|uniref:Uncharacterized protein n=1 Tax=Eumeta variegata TaxID=151549 RepID=A0A4C1YE31_EUMVA|nr:hypothetical protein EVAR_63470_1 [Eumeta japonica]